jgi:2-iminoacetate synthase ThiH
VAAAGVHMRADREQLMHAIREAGFTPAQRRTDYSLVEGAV